MVSKKAKRLSRIAKEVAEYRKKSGTARVGGKVVRVQSRRSMAEINHAHMLADPCRGPLVHPVYGRGDQGSYVTRLEWYQYPLTASNVDFQIVVSPAQWCMSVGVLLGQGIAGASGVLGSAGNQWTGTIMDQAYKARALAYCVEVEYTGSEQNRSGLIGLGYNSGKPVTNSQTVSTATFLPLCQEVARCGSKKHEVKWVPNETDQLFMDKNLATEVYGNSSIIICGAGIAGQALALKHTAVLEWVPKVNASGAAGNGAGLPGPSTGGNFNDVLQVLGTAAQWMFSSQGAMAIQAVRSVVNPLGSAGRVLGAAATASRILNSNNVLRITS